MEVIGKLKYKKDLIKIKLNASEKEIKGLFKNVYFIGRINNALVKHNKQGWWIKENEKWKKMNEGYWKGLRLFW